MVPWELLDSATIPGTGAKLYLHRRGGEFSIRVGHSELMNSRQHGSEEALADLACARLSDHPHPRVLVGGLGMGYTLAAALKRLGAGSQVVVAELVPAVVAWNRLLLGGLADRPLQDARAEVRETNVADILRAEPGAWDAILQDVDNGPDGLTRHNNAWLYSRAGLKMTLKALRPGGILTVWSSAPDSGFTQKLRSVGFEADEVTVRSRGLRKGSRHTIWVAAKRS